MFASLEIDNVLYIIKNYKYCKWFETIYSPPNLDNTFYFILIIQKGYIVNSYSWSLRVDLYLDNSKKQRVTFKQLGNCSKFYIFCLPFYL